MRNICRFDDFLFADGKVKQTKAHQRVHDAKTDHGRNSACYVQVLLSYLRKIGRDRGAVFSEFDNTGQTDDEGGSACNDDTFKVYEHLCTAKKIFPSDQNKNRPHQA